MASINIELERIKKHLFVQRLQNEMSDIEKDSARYKLLAGIYDTLMLKENTLETALAAANDLAYTHKWARLSPYHREQKIKEYIKEKNILEREEEIMQLFKDGKLNPSKTVIYDEKQCKITKIILSKSDIL